MATTPLIDTIRARNLLEGAALREAESLAAQITDPSALAAELVKRGRLTAYQADELAQGRGDHLVLGSYVLLEPIGKGGMGQVFRAKQSVLERECALKIIRKDRLQSSEAVERFLREARVAARLKHPNIVTIYDANVADGTHYLAMELLHGMTLADRVARQGPLSVGAACRYVRQAALGLQHASEQGLVHRDIKPHNLFIEKTHDEVKVLDLGLARIREVTAGDETASGNLTREGEVMGTPDYMAPEQALDTRSADHRADIYSLGCTLYFLIAGRAPFAGGSMTEKLLAHQQREPVALETLCSGVPAGVVAAIKKAMAKQPGDRFQSPAEFAAAIDPFENAENIVAAAGVPVSAIASETRRQPVHETTTDPSLNVAKKPAPGNKAMWIVLAAVLCSGACCLLAPLAIVALFVIAPAGHEVHQGHGHGPAEHDHEAVNVEKPPKRPDELVGADGRFRELRRFEGRTFRLSRDGTRIIHGAGAKYYVSDFETGKKVFVLPDGQDGQGFAGGDPPRVVATHLGQTVHVYDSVSGKEVKKHPLPKGAFRACIPRPDGKSALILSEGQLTILDLEDGKELKQIPFLDDKAPMERIALSGNGLFALTANAKSRLQRWSLTTGLREDLVNFKGDASCLALTTDGRVSLVGFGTRVMVWDIELPRFHDVKDTPHKNEILSVAVSPDGKQMLTGGRDMTMRLAKVNGFDLSEAKLEDVVTQVAFHPDGRRAISASQDNTIRVWSLAK